MKECVPMKRQSGFTLLELMIVLVIVGILASIAIPSYRDSIRKGNRRAAQAVLMDIANRERQYFMANRTFADEGALNYTLPAEVAGKYTFTITPDDGPPPSTREGSRHRATTGRFFPACTSSTNPSVAWLAG